MFIKYILSFFLLCVGLYVIAVRGLFELFCNVPQGLLKFYD